MRSPRPAGEHQQAERPGAESSHPVPPNETLALPSWESFPVADRHQVVSTILRVARRQVAAGPTSSLAKR